MAKTHPVDRLVGIVLGFSIALFVLGVLAVVW